MERQKRRNPYHAEALQGFEKGDDGVDDGFVISYHQIVTLICNSSPTPRISKKTATRSPSFECEPYQYGRIELQRIFPRSEWKSRFPSRCGRRPCRSPLPPTECRFNHAAGACGIWRFPTCCTLGLWNAASDRRMPYFLVLECRC